jgi:hypothetical protein
MLILSLPMHMIIEMMKDPMRVGAAMMKGTILRP